MEFINIYVREAHPVEGWRMSSNDKAGVTVKQPKTYEERAKVAGNCCAAMNMSIPLVVDTMDDRVGHLYSGMPDRLYLIDRSGKVAYKGGRGPFGFKPPELEQMINLLLLEESLPTARVPISSNADTWKYLPKAESGSGSPLPTWASALAKTLPKTTASMLELDYLHRSKSPLNAELRGLIRLTVAKANRCRYTEAYALADLQRSGQSLSVPLSPKLQRVQNFARKMTLEAYKVTDEQVEQLRQDFDDKTVVAMVQLIAYGNFQDRLVLSLGLNLEPGGPLPPVDVKFVKPLEEGSGFTPRSQPKSDPATSTLSLKDTEWTKLDWEYLQQEMNAQKERKPRIPVPTLEAVQPYLPANRNLRIQWSLVCLGYQPDLARGWTNCLRVFEESVFWVITRSLQCFY